MNSWRGLRFLDDRQRKAQGIREAFGLLATLAVLILGKDARIALAWALGMLFGARYKLVFLYSALRPRQNESLLGPSWKGAFCGGIISTLCAVVITHQTVTNDKLWVSVGVGINFAYIGARAGCSILGCCGGLRILRSFFKWHINCSLQVAEIILTIGVLVSGLLATLIAQSQLITIAVLYVGHVMVRVFSAYRRNPFSRRFSAKIPPPQNGDPTAERIK